MKIFILVMIVVVSLSGCDAAQGSSPDNPIYYQCTKGV